MRGSTEQSLLNFSGVNCTEKEEIPRVRRIIFAFIRLIILVEYANALLLKMKTFILLIPRFEFSLFMQMRLAGTFSYFNHIYSYHDYHFKYLFSS